MQPAFSVDTLGLPARDSRVPDPAASRQRAVAHEVMARGLPAYPFDDRYRQTQAYVNTQYLCVRALQDALAAVTVRVQVDRDYAPATVQKALPTPHAEANDERHVPADDDHPLARLFRRPNPIQPFGKWMAGWVLQKELVGEHFIWPVKGHGTDYPVELWNISPALTTPLSMSPKYPMGGIRVANWHPTAIGPTGGYFELDGRDVLRDWDEHPLYPWSAYSRLTAGAMPIDVLNAIHESWKKHMDHGWSPDAVVSVPGASQMELERLQTEFGHRFAGSKGRRVLFTDGESVDVETMTPGAREMDYGSGWDRMVKVACALWQTPAAVVGLEAPGSYAAFYAQLKQYHTNALRPRAKAMADFLTLHLAERYWPGEGLSVVIDLPQIDDQDVLDRQLQADGQLGVRTVNEIRGSRSLKPLDGGNVPPAVYLAQLTGKVQQEQQRAGIAAGLLPDPTKPPVIGGAGPSHGPDGRFASGPPRPDNPDGEGSLPPRSAVAKSLKRILKSLPG